MQATERLMRVTDTMAGSGTLTKGGHRAHVRALRRAARGRPVRPEPEPSTRTEPSSTRSEGPPAAAELAAFGVGVVEVKLAPPAELGPCTSNGHTNTEEAEADG